MSERTRLDTALLHRGLVATRSRARDLIVRRVVTVEGRTVTKPGALVGPDDRLELPETAAAHVSRAAEKLIAGLDAFHLDPAGLVALDIGASTGGFTEVLIARGAALVYSVDVGQSQLHPRLRADPRVVALEGTDARALTRDLIATSIGAIVADVSFISLVKALPAALRLAAPGCWLVALVKPQFEAGRAAIASGGIVRDEAARAAAVAGVRDFLAREGWTVLGAVPSPLPGKDGNREYLIGARRDG